MARDERGMLYPVKRFFRVNCREAARGGFLQVKKPPCKKEIQNRPLKPVLTAIRCRLNGHPLMMSTRPKKAAARFSNWEKRAALRIQAGSRTSGAIFAPTSGSRSDGAASIWQPIRPPLTMTDGSVSTAASKTVGNCFFIPTGEQPPRM